MSVFIFVVGLALVPTLFYILLLWWLDRYEKEPVSLLALAFIWGAVPSIIFALVFEILADFPCIRSYGGDSGVGDWDFLSVAVVGPFIEEGFKAVIVADPLPGLPPRVRRRARRHHLRGDGRAGLRLRRKYLLWHGRRC